MRGTEHTDPHHGPAGQRGYPHSDCTWPDVAEELWENVKDLPDRVIDKITHANAFNFYEIDPIAVGGGRQNCNVGALRSRATGVDTRIVSMSGKDARVQGNVDKPVTARDVWATLAGHANASPKQKSD